VKINLGHHREVMSKGDADNRETRNREIDPNAISMKHGGGIN